MKACDDAYLTKHRRGSFGGVAFRGGLQNTWVGSQVFVDCNFTSMTGTLLLLRLGRRSLCRR